MSENVLALDAGARQVRTACGNGTMVWRCWGSGEPLLLLHGQSGSWRHWLRNIAFFAATHQVWCPDLPGMGESGDPPEPGDAHAVATATLQGLREIPAFSRPCHLAGFSFGGIVGALAASSADVPLRSFVVIGSTGLGLPLPPLGLQSWKREIDAGRRQEIHRANLGRLMLTPEGARDPLALSLYTQDLERDRYQGPPVASTTLLRDALARLRAPVTGIWGARDALVQGEPARAQAGLRSVRPDLRFTTIPGAGHWVAFEQPALFNRALQESLLG
jgi:2-hydroxy-6-oxonona-2,4-dienedioate hydrolase